MKWVLEISDSPENKDYPIVGYQVTDNGIKRGPYLFKVADLVEGLATPLAEENSNIITHMMGNDFTNEKRIPTLPIGTVGYSSSEEGKERISMVVKKGVWPIKYKNHEETYFIGFPKLIVQYVLANLGQTGHKRIVATKIFAIKDDRKAVNDNTKLYQFPFPNVSKGDGTVCWGMNGNLTVANLTELERFFSFFLAAPFGEDYGIHFDTSYRNFGEYIKSEQDKPFNDDLLLPIMLNGEQLTFGSLHPRIFYHPQCK